MSRGQALMEKAEIDRRKVLVSVKFRIRLDGIGALTRDMDIEVDEGSTLENIRENVIPRVAEEIRQELEITAEVREVEFRTED